MGGMNIQRKQEIEGQLQRIFRERYTVENLVSVFPQDFQNYIESQLGQIDSAVEGFSEDEAYCQADVNTDFHFGHNHDFGTFQVKGKMGDRHTHVLAGMMTFWDLPYDYFEGKTVLDVGCWCGGTSLMLAAMGANVIACEEVVKHARMARYLARSFGAKVEVVEQSVYDCPMNSDFDIVYFPGVLYHLSDPLVGLRILFNTLKEGGELLLESAARQLVLNIEHKQIDGAFVEYWGPRRGGWNWFVPNKMALTHMLEDVGFKVLHTEYLGDRRIYARALKEKWVGVCKAGFSRRDV